MNIRAGTRICSLGGNARGTVLRVLENGMIEAQTDAGSVVKLSARSYRILKPKLTAKDLVLLREMRIKL